MRWQHPTTIATVIVVAYAGAILISHLVSSLRPAAQPERWAANDFPNVPLVTQDGARVRFYDDLIKGKAVAINLMYTSCKDECPLETARLVQTQKILGDRVGKDLFFYSISIDPRIDTPAVLKEYAEKFRVGPGWEFLTGDENDIRLVAKKLGLNYRRDLSAADGHATTLLLGDEPTGQWMQNSAEDNPRFLATTISHFMGWPDQQASTSYAEARPLDLDRGGYVFATRCVGCHTIGGGDLVGPDLAGVTDRRDRTWLAQYLINPDQALASGDPIASALYARYHQIPMPNLNLSDDDIGSLLAYLEAHRGTPERVSSVLVGGR